MGNFLRKTKRSSESNKRLEYKLRYRAYVNLLKTLTSVAEKLNKEDVTYTESNLPNYVEPILGRVPDSMEVFFIASHLNKFEIESENNDK